MALNPNSLVLITRGDYDIKRDIKDKMPMDKSAIVRPGGDI